MIDAIGPYRVLGKLGEGGMGEVYRARDTRLGRDVALKILPDSVAADPDRLARFEREARVLASLNHPNIAAIYGVEHRAIVMELVDGRTLADLLRSAGGEPAPLPPDDALRIARQIAEALEAAHELGIVHRDLKPANVKVREDGTVKVLDFGLAKAMDPATAGGSSDPSAGPQPRSGPSDFAAPTMTSPAQTAMGMILGTAAYMAPEQARGKSADRRADVWAFGVVFYEMLTGRRLFERDEVSDTLAAVLTTVPDLALLPASTPPAVRRLLARCLVREKRDRLDSMSVARLEIDEALRAPATPPEIPREPPGIRVRSMIAIATAALLLGAFGATAWVLFARPAAETSSPIVAQIGPPPDVISAFQEGFALSPDGTTLAFAARDANGVRQIWVRRLDTAAAQPLRGTEGGNYPFWSPDSAHVGFFADGQLRRVAAAGGQVQTVCATRGQFPSGSWNEADDILFGVMRERHLRIYRAPAAGGDPTQIALDGEAIRPEWLPGGRRFLYAGGTETDWGLRIGSVDGGPSELVTGMVRWNYAYSRAGYVFLNQNDALTAQRFDADAGRLTGSPVTLTGRAGTPKTWFAVSSSGTQLVALARQSPSEPGDPGDPWARLRWINRRGEFVGELGDSGRYWTLRLAPDGQRASVNPGSEIWVLDPNQRHLRLTSDGIESMHAVWSVDGSEVIYEHGENEIVRQAVSHGARHSVLPNALGLVGDWSRDGRWLILERTSATDPSRDLSLYDLETQSVQPWLATEFDEVQARFSPDGRWIAYASNATGRFEVYVRAREGAGRQTTISTRGGVHPIWRGDGRELFYLSPDDEMMAAAILAEGATLGVGETTRLFRVPINDITKGFYSPYDVAPDGQRFLLNVPDRPSSLFFLRGLDGLVR